MNKYLYCRRLLKGIVSATMILTLSGQIIHSQPLVAHAEEVVGVQSSKGLTQYVENFTQLKNYLEGDNNITNVIVKNDIEMSSGIGINKKKTSVTIDFQGHRLTEKDSSNLYDTIHVSSNTGTKEVNLKNAVIEGKNYYGTIGIAEIAKNVTTNFENISYTGPQFLRNSGGTANFFGNNTFEIKNVGSISPVKEFAEVANMSIAGNFDVKHIGNTDTTFNFTSTHPSLVVNDDAQVNILNEGAQAFQNNAGNLDLSIKSGAQVNFVSAAELSKDNGFGTVTIDRNALLSVNREKTIHPGSPTLIVNKELVANPESSIVIDHNEKIHADVIKTAPDVTVTFNGMKKLELKGILGDLATNFGERGILNLTTDHIAGWETSTTEKPDFAVNEHLEASFNMSGGSIDSVIQSNIADILSKLTYKNPYKLVIGDDIAEEVPDPIFNEVYDKDNKITGLGVPGDTIIATINGVEIGRTVVGPDGKWSIDITPQEAGTVITVVQEKDGQQSGPVDQTVKHLDVETVNHFKLGYWQSYGLILEGSIDNADYDLTNPDNVHKVISLYSSSNTEVLSVNCENTDWYNTGVYNGYQAIITTDELALLPTGTYKLVISMSTGEHYDSEDLDVTSSSEAAEYPPFHTKFDEIGSNLLPSGMLATPINQGNVGYIVIE
ncbi:Ig-like domain-containing protein [Enterococcus thailandicus]|uniref:Ig-like domain-containing protein n=1 Tax=Enterococcus thailandicus TaxID=417368 RepID=UPI0035D8DCF4